MTEENSVSRKSNYALYNEYLMSLIPKDENKEQKYVALLEQKHGDDPRFSDTPCFAIMENLAPIPLRFLRKEDAFVLLPLESNNPTIYFAKSTPRNSKVIITLNQLPISKLTFKIDCRPIKKAYLEIPNITDNSFNDDTVAISE